MKKIILFSTLILMSCLMFVSCADTHDYRLTNEDKVTSQTEKAFVADAFTRFNHYIVVESEHPTITEYNMSKLHSVSDTLCFAEVYYVVSTPLGKMNFTDLFIYTAVGADRYFYIVPEIAKPFLIKDIKETDNPQDVLVRYARERGMKNSETLFEHHCRMYETRDSTEVLLY